MTNALHHWIGRGAFIAALALVVPLDTFGQAEPAPVGERPEQQQQEIQLENRFAPNIAAAKVAAANLKGEYTQMSEELQWRVQAGILGDDLEKAKVVYDSLVAGFEDAAKAWSSGDDAEAQKLHAAAQTAMPSKDVWRQRMFEYRFAQSNAAPTEQWYTETVAIAREGALPAFQNLVEKKKGASEAWRNVAEAAVPGVSPQLIDELKEKAFAAMGEADIASWQFNWSNQLEGLLSSDMTVSKEDVEAPLAKLLARQEDLASLRRKQIENERSIRQALAETGKAQEELNKAFWAAREAKAQAATAAAGDVVK